MANQPHAANEGKVDFNECAFEPCHKTGIYVLYNCKCQKEIAENEHTPERKYCKKHKAPESHQCTYDYLGHHQKELSDNNPVVENSKVPKF